MTVFVPSVWALIDEHDQDAAIAAALGLRRAANEHRCAGQHRDALEFDELADELERVVTKVQAHYREAHPPGSKAKARIDGNDAGLPGESTSVCRTEQVSTRIVPGVPSDYRDETP